MNVSQQLKQLELNLPTCAPTLSARAHRGSETFIASRPPEHPTGKARLLEKILERENMHRALQRVVANDGAPGVDGMTVQQLKGFLKRNWPTIRQALLDGVYIPLPLRRKEIDKPEGGVRMLGIPSSVDRLIQQAVAQVLGPIWDPTFSDNSFGFRPERSAHDAIRRCRQYLRAGYRYVVDLDLAKFFDRVNHDRLLSRLATRIQDKRVLKLVRRFLESGVMVGGMVSPTEEGTPQGGPLSPLLSNIVLDELDKELEKRGLRFVRYADDCVIYVASKRAAHRVMESVTTFVTRKLRLEVNREKSAVGRPWHRKYLGFCFTNSSSDPQIRLHWKSVKRFRQRVREITRRARGRSVGHVIGNLMSYMRGWWQYFGIAESLNRLRPLSHWVRRRLRALVWTHWKNRRTRVGHLLAAGVPHEQAVTTGCSRKGAWRTSGVYAVPYALPDIHFTSLGLSFPWLEPV